MFKLIPGISPVRFCMIFIMFLFFSSEVSGIERKANPDFRVIAFYTAKSDQGHISFVREANKWFIQMADKHNFSYDSTDNWNNLNKEFLSSYQVIIFLDTRPDSDAQRAAFRQYIENGGAWMGFHFSAFALNNSAFPQNWDWYHNIFLGAGEYKGNTWRPTKAVLRVNERKHPATKHLPEKFLSSPNEWYSWKNDISKNPDIEILLSIDPSSFPLGTGPKQYEIWHSGFFPVVWTNKNFRMLYINMGHNDIDYEKKTNKELSYTFNNKFQNRLIRDGLLWLGKNK
jgi:hypothetical protein